MAPRIYQAVSLFYKEDNFWSSLRWSLNAGLPEYIFKMSTKYI